MTIIAGVFGLLGLAIAATYIFALDTLKKFLWAQLVSGNVILIGNWGILSVLFDDGLVRRVKHRMLGYWTSRYRSSGRGEESTSHYSQSDGLSRNASTDS